MIVVDANVAVKWHIPEQGEQIADDILRSTDVLVAPTCIRNEVLSAIVRSVAYKRITPEKADHQCKLWLEQLADRDVMMFDEDDLRPIAIKLGIKHSHYYLDCLYLALCQTFKASLVTFDVQLAKVAKREGIACKLLDENQGDTR